ncbi:MAG: NTP transferase domain-containing protein [Planctomycetota bacterium]|jgi:bifunctional N-acetylglucosamine-1-phosphate-uridyltransferase/glucosamine-1-phosphate-acetyltransferase GlmU-like protein|nr:NTP transferase domain-containing protein [Planctomycetota bacterium]
MSSLQACVLAAGKGTRMGGDRPKVLFEANGKPLLEWVLGALSEAGVDSCVVVVGHGKEEVIAKLPAGVRWVEQSPQLGTGHAVRCARAAFNDGEADGLLVACGDMPLVRPGTYRRLAELRRREGADAALLVVAVPAESRFGRVVRNPAGGVERVVEYKDASPEERRISEGSAGVYCFRPAALWPALEAIGNDNVQGEYYLPDVLPRILVGGGRVLAVESEDAGEELGVNTPEDLTLAARALAERAGKGGGG